MSQRASRLKTIALPVAFALAGLGGSAWAADTYQWWALDVKADTFHARQAQDPGGNYTGNGITLAIVDTGISAHPEYSTRILTGYNYWGGNGTEDGDGHGTHVSGIAAAGQNNGGIVGIAPDAWLLPVKILDDRGYGSSATIYAGVKWAVDNYVRPISGTPTNKTVFNMSLGGNSAFGLDSLSLIRNSGSIGVVAAGNSGKKDPSYPARYVTDPSVAGWMLAVGAVDSNNKITSWSNRAGSAANYYLVAPGLNVYSTYLDSSYATMSGTSMATPMVTGAAALVWGHWPYLTGDKVVSSLLWSATDLGAAGVDSVYGWGLLNLEAAMSPIGDTCIPTGTNSCSSTGTPTKPGIGKGRTKSFSTPAAAGMAAAGTSSTLIGYDSLGRHFTFSAAAVLTPGGISVTNNMNGWMAASQPIVVSAAYGGKRFALQGGSQGVESMSISQPVGGRGEFLMFSGPNLLPFGAAGLDAGYKATAFVGGDTLKIPYLALVESPLGMAYTHEVGRGLNVKLGFVTGYNPSQASRSVWDVAVPAAMIAHAGNSGQALLGEVAVRHGRFSLAATVGSLHEDDAFLGARNIDSATRGDTRFHGFSASCGLGAGYTVMSSYSQGLSRGKADGQAAAYNVTTQAFSLGLMKEKFLTDNDRLTLSATLPSRVSKGDVTLNAAVGVNMKTGEPIMGYVPVSLVPQGQERRFGMSWSTPLRAGDLALTLMRRLEPNHDATANAETVLGMRISKTF